MNYLALSNIKKALFVSLVLLPNLILAQFQTPVTLSAKVEDIVRAGEVANVVVNLSMDDEWWVYALRDQGKGPVASNVSIVSDIVDQAGKVLEEEPTEKYDEGFLTTTKFHKGGALFTAPILLKSNISPGTYDLEVSVLYQVCNVSLCYPPSVEKLIVQIEVGSGPTRENRTEMIAAPAVVADSKDMNLNAEIEKGFFSFVLLAISMAFLSLLTPCVFPMIPITVSFFIHQGEVGQRKPLSNAIIYTLGIIATFSILGFILALTLGASGANQLAANPWVNLFIAALFIYFALSLFGMYEIEMPAKLREFSLKQEGRGGIIGTLFMAVTFTLTSFTCTVQFVGLLLVAASQGYWF